MVSAPSGGGEVDAALAVGWHWTTDGIFLRSRAWGKRARRCLPMPADALGRFDTGLACALRDELKTAFSACTDAESQKVASVRCQDAQDATPLGDGCDGTIDETELEAGELRVDGAEIGRAHV